MVEKNKEELICDALVGMKLQGTRIVITLDFPTAYEASVAAVDLDERLRKGDIIKFGRSDG